MKLPRLYARVDTSPVSVPDKLLVLVMVKTNAVREFWRNDPERRILGLLRASAATRHVCDVRAVRYVSFQCMTVFESWFGGVSCVILKGQ